MFLQMSCGHFHAEFGVHQSKDAEIMLDQTDVHCPPICWLHWKEESAGRCVYYGRKFSKILPVST
jgi:hypothetical protein